MDEPVSNSFPWKQRLRLSNIVKRTRIAVLDSLAARDCASMHQVFALAFGMEGAMPNREIAISSVGHVCGSDGRQPAGAVDIGEAGATHSMRKSHFAVRLAACLIACIALLSGCAFLFQLFPEEFPYPDEPGFEDPYFQDLYRTDDLFRAAYDEYHGKYIVFRKIEQSGAFYVRLQPDASPAQIREYKYFEINYTNFKTFKTDLQHYELGAPKLTGSDRLSYQLKYQPIFAQDYLATSASMLQLQRYASNKLGCQVSISGGAAACAQQQHGLGISHHF
jgi:hypothetical protein